MKALFYKDTIALKGNFKAFLILFIIEMFAITSNYVDMAYMVSALWLVDFLIRTFDTEHKNNFYKYVISNAVDKKFIVIYKYLLIFTAIISVFFINFLMTFLTGYDKTLSRFILFSGVNILLHELLIPIFFRFGKISRDIAKLGVAVPYILLIYSMTEKGTLLRFEIENNISLFAIVLIIDLIVFAFSFWLSLKFIEKKVT